MDDYAAYLAGEARSEIAALHQFRILYDPNRDDLHFFVEGEDDGLFYLPSARRYTRERVLHLYDCGGKKNVIATRSLIKSGCYSVEKCLFFVDRDYDDMLGTQVEIDECTYITDGYSIENHFASIEAAKIILAEIIKISKADPEFERIIESLDTGFSEFYKRVRPLIAWILAAKELGYKPNLRNTNGLNKIMEIRDSGPVMAIDGFPEFKRKVGIKGNIPTIKSILKWRRKLCVSNAKIWVRGKYDIWFFHMSLIAALNQTNKKRERLGVGLIKIPSSLKEGRVFEILGGRYSPPISLQNFLKVRLT